MFFSLSLFSYNLCISCWVKYPNKKTYGQIQMQGFPKQEYRIQKCMDWLKNDTEIKEDISFAKLHNKGCLIYYLVYNSKISVPDAVISAYEVGITLDNLKDMALLLRSSIIRSFREMDNLPWPPTANDLDFNLNEQPPKELIKFIHKVLVVLKRK